MTLKELIELALEGQLPLTTPITVNGVPTAFAAVLTREQDVRSLDITIDPEFEVV